MRLTQIALGVADSKTDFAPNEKQHGPDERIPAPRHVVDIFEIPLDNPGVKEPVDWPLIERRIDQAKRKLAAESDEHPGCAKHGGAFDPPRRRAAQV
jgi:hypothetical protein